MPTTIDIARGALAAETHLLGVLAELAREARAEPRLLATPVRIVVPSRSLRLHLSERIAREGTALGVTVETLFTAAAAILDRAGIAAGGGDALIELLARRRARTETALREAFEGFEDGYAGVVAGVRDLLDAGFEPGHAEALGEHLDEVPLPHAERKRAHAVVSVAAAVAGDLAAREAGGRAELLRRAREEFLRDPVRTLPTRALLVHGFADATGRAADLLEAFAQRLPARILFDHPPDPDDLARTDLGAQFAERLLERLRGAATEVHSVALEPAGDVPALFSAPGPTAEAREVARRVRALLDAGGVPERIGIVARDLTRHATPLGLQLDRLGIPFGGLRARGGMDGAARRVHALCELLAEGAGAPIDRWLDATARIRVESEEESRSRLVSGDLRLGLRVAGVARLEDAIRLDPDALLRGSKGLKLPVRIGVEVLPESEADPRFGRLRASHRRLHGDELRAAILAARQLEQRFKRWPRRAPLARHLGEFERLRRQDLGWSKGDESDQRATQALLRLADALDVEEVTREEFAQLVQRELPAASLPPLGNGRDAEGAAAGNGAGVQVLDAMEARGRTFEHIFLVGLNRGAFPRSISEDPLLPDALRLQLADVLPDVPIKARGRSEDRYLFAQLVASATAVTLSWHFADDDGKAQVVSPLVERLLREEEAQNVPKAPPLFPARAPAAGELVNAHEHAVLSGLLGEARGRDERWSLALAEAGLGERAAPAAAARSRVLDAYEAASRKPEALAPWLGFLGDQAASGIRPDPRVDAPYVTRLENLARCPWQLVLTKFLRLEEPPDPMEALPGIEPFALGNIVHSVLQRIDEHSLGASDLDLAQAAARTPVRTEWPDADTLEELLHAAAHEEAAKHHAPLPGFVRMLAECARPFVERARVFLAEEAERWPEGGVLGAEVFGRARIERAPEDGGDLEVVFRADRVERQGTELVLSDYKTGKPKKTKVFLTEGIPRGEQLQPMAYVLAGRAHADEVMGRYLYLGANEAENEELEVKLGARHADHLGDFTRAVSTLVDGWVRGTFFPRLHDPARDKPPKACKFCDVKEACLLGDSGARMALLDWAGGDAAPAGIERDTLRELWRLAALKRDDGTGRKRR